MSDSNIPTMAIKTFYQASNGHAGYYYIWPFDCGWHWAALGNTGEASTQGAAREAACRWIRDGC